MRFTLASNRYYTDREGKNQTEVAYVPCKASGAWAGALSGQRKGQLVIVSGRLKSDAWNGADGNRRSQLTLICQAIHAVRLALKPDSAATPTSEDEPGNGDTPVPF